MSGLLSRLPGHIILFTGVLIGGFAAIFIYASYTNVFAWAALVYGIFSAAVGIAAILR